MWRVALLITSAVALPTAALTLFCTGDPKRGVTDPSIGGQPMAGHQAGGGGGGGSGGRGGGGSAKSKDGNESGHVSVVDGGGSGGVDGGGGSGGGNHDDVSLSAANVLRLFRNPAFVLATLTRTAGAIPINTFNFLFLYLQYSGTARHACVALMKRRSRNLMPPTPSAVPLVWCRHAKRGGAVQHFSGDLGHRVWDGGGRSGGGQGVDRGTKQRPNRAGPGVPGVGVRVGLVFMLSR